MPRSQVRADKLFEKKIGGLSEWTGIFFGKGVLGQQGFSSVEKVFP
jgi:hypothetical protein